MENIQKYVIDSLELHLFFGRIMKEHALFLEAGFPPPNANFARRADYFKTQFEQLLRYAVQISDGFIRQNVLRSGEIVTEFTERAERQTQRLTGIDIDTSITVMEKKLIHSEGANISPDMAAKVRRLNRAMLMHLDGLIEFKENILENVFSCQMFTMNYPLLIEHILREAKLYREYLQSYEQEKECRCDEIKQIELFWNQIMMEHALFIRGLLDPSENELIQTSEDFAEDYARLLDQSKKMNDQAMMQTEEILRETVRFRDFKKTGTVGIENCRIRSLILPLLADHVLREANHYIRLLEEN